MRKSALIVCVVSVIPGLLLEADMSGAGISTSESGMDIASPKSAAKGELKETLNSAQKAFDEASRVTYQGMVPQTEEIQQDAESCLNGIMNTDFSGAFGFDLGLPSVNDLLGKACDKINSGIQDHIDTASQEFTPQYLDGLVNTEMNIGLGSSASSYNSIDYYDEGERIADDLWQRIEREKTWLRD